MAECLLVFFSVRRRVFWASFSFSVIFSVIFVMSLPFSKVKHSIPLSHSSHSTSHHRIMLDEIAGSYIFSTLFQVSSVILNKTNETDVSTSEFKVFIGIFFKIHRTNVYNVLVDMSLKQNGKVDLFS